MGQIGDAFEWALRAHSGQVDKSGAPYIAHVVRVANAVEGDAAQVVALLHDVVEDTAVTQAQVAEAFGSEIAEAVAAITHLPNEDRTLYMQRVAANPLAAQVKRADIADNMSPQRMANLSEAEQSRLTAKYTRALDVLGSRCDP
jgi:(p)ppGpp synthase/HD superfamily hydrolase